MSTDDSRGLPATMKKRLKKILCLGGLAAGSLILLLAAAGLLFFLDKPLVKSITQKYLAKKSGIGIEIGALDYKLFPLRISISSLKATYETPGLTMDVLVNRIEARGALKKLLNGDGPAFETADVDIADLRVNQKNNSGTPTDFGTIILQTADLLSFTRRVSIKCGRLDFSLPGQNFRLEKVDLGLAGTRAVGIYDFLLDAKYIGATTNDGSLAFESRLHADGTLALARTTGINLRLVLDAPRFTAAGKDDSLKSLNIEADGVWTTNENKFSIMKFVIGVPDLIVITGSGAVDLGKNMSLDINARAQIDSLESIAAIAAPYFPPAVREARIQGKTRLEGHYLLTAGQRINTGKLEASVDLDNVKLDYNKAGFPIHGELSGLVKFAGSPPEIQASADFRAAIGRISRDHLDIRQSSVQGKFAGILKLAGSPPEIQASADIRAAIGRISRDHLDIRQSSVRFKVNAKRNIAEITDFEGILQGLAYSFPGEKGLAFDEVRLNGAARLDIGRKSIVLTALETRLPKLAPIRFSGQFDFDPVNVRQARLESKGLKIPALRGLLAPFMPAGLAGWEIDGALDVGIEAGTSPGRKGVWEYSGEFAMSQIKFNDPSFTIAGDGLQQAARFKGTYEPAKEIFAWTGSMELTEGESLWKDLYISWSKQPLEAYIAGRFSRAEMFIDGLTARIVFSTLGELHAGGSVRLGTSSSLRLQAGARLSLDPLYALYSQAGANPEKRMRVSGEISGDFEIMRDGDALSLKGRLAVGDAMIENSGANIAVHGITADVPVNYVNKPATETIGAMGRAEPSETGIFQVQEIKTPFLAFPPIALTLHSLPNAFRIDAFSLDIFGARLEFGETALAFDPRTGAFHGGASLNLPGLDLSRLPVATAQFPLSGRARAEFPVLDIASDKITTTGRAEIETFGGRVVVRDVVLVTPFSPGRAISCNVDLLDLDLKKVTDVVPFGEMTGIIRGEALGLTISYAQPESFNLNLESVPRKGVAQTFSLKAVDNLTVLSSGQKASMGSGQFWMRFIRGFRYKKIGIASTLKNDTFTLNGTIHEKGVEYLVKKPALFGINVINRMPDKKISFKEMMSRLERVEQSEKPELKK
jgi:hypothetical protein